MDERQERDPELPSTDSIDALEVRPPAEVGDPIDWPDRSHWSEFDRAIEGARPSDLGSRDSRVATGESPED